MPGIRSPELQRRCGAVAFNRPSLSTNWHKSRFCHTPPNGSLYTKTRRYYGQLKPSFGHIARGFYQLFKESVRRACVGGHRLSAFAYIQFTLHSNWILEGDVQLPCWRSCDDTQHNHSGQFESPTVSCFAPFFDISFASTRVR